jgi:hypothetical protein
MHEHPLFKDITNIPANGYIDGVNEDITSIPCLKKAKESCGSSNY